MQQTCRLQVRPGVDGANDRRRGARTQRFFECPERLKFIFSLDQDQAGRIDAETVEAMPVRAAMVADAFRRDDEKDRTARGDAGEKGRRKAERSRNVRIAVRENLVKR